MPRSTTIAAHQAAQRGPNHVGMTEIDVDRDAAQRNGHQATRDPFSGELVDSEPSTPTMAERFRALNIEARCTAEMSLHMITGRVRDEADIQVELGGHRASWWAASERGRLWADEHPSLTRDAPEGAECQVRFCEPIIRRALMDGLIVMAGDVEVTLC